MAARVSGGNERTVMSLGRTRIASSITVQRERSSSSAAAASGSPGRSIRAATSSAVRPRNVHVVTADGSGNMSRIQSGAAIKTGNDCSVPQGPWTSDVVPLPRTLPAGGLGRTCPASTSRWPGVTAGRAPLASGSERLMPLCDASNAAIRQQATASTRTTRDELMAACRRAGGGAGVPGRHTSVYPAPASRWPRCRRRKVWRARAPAASCRRVACAALATRRSRPGRSSCPPAAASPRVGSR